MSRVTVLAAYEQLQAEGYLQSFRGAGACIAASIPAPRRARAAPSANAAGRPADAPRLSRRAKRLMMLPEERQRAIAGAFRVSLPALDCFPSRAWSRLVSRHARRAAVEDMAYGDALGEPAFRAAIAEYLGAVRAVRCDSFQVIVTSGSSRRCRSHCEHCLIPGMRSGSKSQATPARTARWSLRAARAPRSRLMTKG